MQLPFNQIDDSLLAGCINKNRKSQKELYDLLSPYIYALILNEGFNQKEAQETLQRVFVEIFNSVENYDGKGSFENWYLEVYRHIVGTSLKDSTIKTNEILFK